MEEFRVDVEERKRLLFEAMDHMEEEELKKNEAHQEFRRIVTGSGPALPPDGHLVSSQPRQV